MLPPLVSKFVAGTTISESVQYAEGLYEKKNIKPIVNTLGEHYHDESYVEDDVETYIELSSQLEDSSIENPTISVKPSQLGIDISLELFEESLSTVVESSNCRVWVDMESYETFHDTVTIVTQLVDQYPNQLGLCLQANIRETEDVIVDEIAGLPMDVRLVKGAYSESQEVAYQSKEQVDESYKSCIETAFQEFSGQPTGLALGTHHDEMIDYGYSLQEDYELERFEIQMLMGVREERQREIADKSDVEMYQYIPFGPAWFSYFYRRIREKKENALFALRAVLGV